MRKLAIISLSLSITAAATAHPTYSLTDIGDLPGGNDDSYAVTINDSGHVAGISDSSAGETAFRWTPSTGIVALPKHPNRTGSFAYYIDSLGNITGSVYSSAFNVDSLPVMWKADNTLVDIGLPSGWTWALGNGANEHGNVVGWGLSPSGRRGYTWTASGGFQVLSPLSGDAECGISGINGKGEMCGWSGNRATVWVGGVQSALPLPPGAVDAYPNWITDEGRVCGYGVLGGGLYNAGVWDTKGRFTLIDQFPGYPSMDCAWVDPETNVTVAAAYSNDFDKCILWTPYEGGVDFDTLIDPTTPGWQVKIIGQSNKFGQMVGYGIRNGVGHAFVATPSVSPKKVDVVFGRADQGSLKSFEAEDGDGFRVCKFLIPNQTVAPITVTFEARSPVAKPSSLILRLRSRMSVVGSFNQTLDLFDWQANDYSGVDVRTDAVGQTAQTRELVATGDLTRYVGTGRTFRARYRIRPNGPLASQSWCSETDLIAFVTRP